MEEFLFAHWFGLSALVLVLVALATSFFTVEQQDVAIIERLGKFHRTATAGLGWKVPLVDRIAGHESLRVEQLKVQGQMKTKDNVFVNVWVAVQFFVSDPYSAFYKLEDHEPQITAYVLDNLRTNVPIQTLDEVFASKDHLSTAIKEELTTKMSDYGFKIVDAVVTAIDPADEHIKAAMNSIVAAQREQIAAAAKGEAEKILVVKQAEAEAESKRLQGEGVANQRKAIIAGLKEAIMDFDKVPGAKVEDVMQLVLVTQFFDTVKEVAHGESNTILLPYTPGGMADIANQMREAILSTSGKEKA